ncbi:MAG: exosortase/archaeosortase family protein [Pirellulaceae bacterium]
MKKRKYIAPSSILKPEFSRIGNRTKGPDQPAPEGPQEAAEEGIASNLVEPGVAASPAAVDVGGEATETATAKAMPFGGMLSAGSVLFFLLVGAAGIWSFWPSLLSLTQTWEREPDYSHGWLVVPMTLFLLWNRRDTMPKMDLGWHWLAIPFLALVLAVRIFGAWGYYDFAEAWAIPFSVIGLSWLAFGRKWVWWAMPALGFLFFMIPLPFRIENQFSQPLQLVATKLSVATLQTLGQPAVAEGTTILLGPHQLEVERACSGLRIFFGMFALSYVYCVLSRRSWLERLLILLATIPIALIANATRIVLTAFAFQWFPGEWAKHVSHDLMGFLMIGLAAILFGAFLWYLGHLFIPAGGGSRNPKPSR